MTEHEKQHEFVSLVKAHERLILKVCSMYSSCRWGDLQDRYQEAVCALWKAYDSYRGESKISTWIYAVCRYTMINLMRQHKDGDCVVSLEDINEPAADSADNALLDELREALSKLPPQDRDLFVMWMEGFKNDEIAQVLDLKVGTVAVRLTRLKMRLRKMMKRETHGGKL